MKSRFFKIKYIKNKTLSRVIELFNMYVTATQIGLIVHFIIDKDRNIIDYFQNFFNIQKALFLYYIGSFLLIVFVDLLKGGKRIK
ncbi:hypothetical protein N8E87_07500 [Avibacterium paragallinarum]|uniref:hypothetical protein n=1 Tax=Avibacterium paragallinarum TaxID=728 RepID=UPI0021F6A810|nr:hypothetical protein [Avibacterium paragallinarum]UXN36044.1 hypothetical protein N8E87_07500 [Avibacterium paragallinarum]